MIVTTGTKFMANEYQNFLRSILMEPSNASEPSLEPLSLFSHWATVIGGIFIPEIRLARLRVREVAKTLENFVRYSWPQQRTLKIDKAPT
jgi:hypothetical protein